ncbi:MAG: type II toxin-antitoxin system RelE/ParE family toxin [Pseudomonadota bacterium]
MAKVIWPDQAIDDLEQISAYIKRFDPTAAKEIRIRLVRLGQSLAELPNRGRPAFGGSRELTSVPPYVLRYVVENDSVVVVHIRHGRRRPVNR